MIRDTEDVVARLIEALERSAGEQCLTIDVDECAELAAAIRADRQSLSDRIDGLTRPSEETLTRIGEAAEGAVLSEMSWPQIGEAACAALHQEGIAP